ncbi:hypothetical protein CPB83DRAFT_801359 [Crepidotus variabilis]|uniref:G domain-containing protein n=1 Tax=Crepidotus variabilis TaxID=179855 RepID=A0A9P6JHP9_9AGAR|nr:hypothetical protein CPB83DRAFT_801359 [Crepidotus variabilis]
MSPSKNEIIIAVMGPTGSGKSQIIDLLSGSTKWAGSNLKPETDQVREIKAIVPVGKEAREITLVETPGFDDIDKSDAGILQMLADWMATRSRNSTKLTGILYLHRITDNRQAGTPHRNLRLFKKLCGDELGVERKVVFVTTMWDKNQGEPGRLMAYQKRQDELREYWRPMLTLGAQVAEFNKTREAAVELICRVISQHSVGGVARLQEELVDLNLPLDETRAAQVVGSQYQSLIAEHRGTLLDLDRAMQRTNDPSMVADLHAERERVEAELNKIVEQGKAMRIGFFSKLKNGLFGKKTKGRGVEF